MHILVVEDDAPLAKIVKKSLESGGHTVDVAIDGQEGLDLGRQRSHDAVVLDIQLPKVNGMDVCRMLREDGNQVPIIMLTAKVEDVDRIVGLEVGADDYLPKPFSLAELQARLRALSRRGRPNGTEVLEAGPLTLDPAARELRVNGSAVEMTGTELALLEHLMQNAGVVLSRDQLREHVWGDGPEPTSNVVDIYVHYVRRKLRAAGVTDDPIRTVRGLGYAFRRQE